MAKSFSAVGYRSVEDVVTVPDLHATILHQLGIDHNRLTYRHHGSDETLTDARVTGPMSCKSY